MEHQTYLNQETLYYYESLNPAGRQALLNWLESHLAQLAIPKKIKSTGLEKLLSGELSSPSALLLIREARKRLNPETLV